MGTAMWRKKSKEQAYVRSFLRIGEIPARVLDDNREAPDFLLEVDGRLVGLEVTEVFVREHPRASTKAAESVVDEIIDRAWRVYTARGGKALQVGLQFAWDADLRRVNRILAADAIASFLLLVDTPVGPVWHYDRRTPGFDRLPIPLVQIIAYCDPSLTVPVWTAPRAGWVAPLDSSALQSYIDDKAAKITRYRDAAPELWLLLAIDGRAPSQFFEPTQTPPTVISPFDRTYLYFGFSGIVQRLPSVT